jgi:membrane fusion protein, multidrug efflux system
MRQSIIIFLLFVLAACHQAPAPVQSAKKSDNYKLDVIRQGNVGASLQLPGVLQPYYRVDMYPKVNGFVKELYVDRGSIVHQGQTLAVLEAPEIDQQYFAAQSKYLQAQALYITSKDSYNRLLSTSAVPGTVAANDLELAKSKMVIDSENVDADYADLKAQETERGYLTITAPFNGVITERNISLGTLVGPTTKIENTMPLLILEEWDKLRLTVNIPEAYCDLVGNKTPVTFTLDALPGQTFNASISRSAASLDMKFRSETVEIDVINNKGLIKPGMYAEVNIPLQRKNPPLIIPTGAIIKSTERHYVIVVTNGATHYVDIKEGNSHNDSTEIYGPLQEGDSVISNANDEIKEGIKVN